MYEVQGVPTDRKWKNRILSALVGVLLGAGVASGVFWFLMREQEKRHQLEMVAVTTGAATPAALIQQAGNLLGGSLAPTEIKSETSPTTEEIATYLNGKTLPLPDGDSLRLNQGEKSAKSCVMKKDSVDTVEKENGYRVGNEPWSTPIVFLYNAEEGRYAVEAEISHQPVGNKTAFFGFTVKRVAKQ